MIRNEKFRNAVNNIPQKVPPIWFMRQAGRYHSHYQNLRKKYSFVQLCKTPELAAEVAMGPINDFDYDVAILSSDILFPLESLGLELDYAPGPVFNRFLNENDLLRDIFSLNDLETDTVRLNASTIKQLFEDTNYSLKDVREKKLVKPVALTLLPAEIKMIESSKQRKDFFIQIILPLILQENNNIRLDRKRLFNIINKSNNSDLEKKWLDTK